jgi:hypothetical protein
MTELHVKFAGRGIMFAALVSDFSCDGNVARSANFPRFADGLLLSASLLVGFITCHNSKVNVAVCAGFSNPLKYARRTRHTVAARLFVRVCTVTTTAFTAAFAHELLGHGTRETANHVIVMCYVVVHVIDSCWRIDVTFVHYAVTVQTFVNHDLILAEMVLKSFDFGDSSPVTQVDTCRR